MRWTAGPFWLGFRDGWARPWCLGSGLTWDSDVPGFTRLNESCDRGANTGQALGRLVRGHPIAAYRALLWGDE